MLKTMCGTPTYLAPGSLLASRPSRPATDPLRSPNAEVILKNDPNAGYGPVVDAWSVGVILYSCMTNQTPFDESESTPLPERMQARRVDFSPLEEANVSPEGEHASHKRALDGQLIIVATSQPSTSSTSSSSPIPTNV